MLGHLAAGVIALGDAEQYDTYVRQLRPLVRTFPFVEELSAAYHQVIDHYKLQGNAAAAAEWIESLRAAAAARQDMTSLAKANVVHGITALPAGRLWRCSPGAPGGAGAEPAYRRNDDDLLLPRSPCPHGRGAGRACGRPAGMRINCSAWPSPKPRRPPVSGWNAAASTSPPAGSRKRLACCRPESAIVIRWLLFETAEAHY